LYFFGALLVGVVLGGLATWLAQARWRRGARRAEAETQRRRAEAERLSRDRQFQASRQLASAGS
jgi:hypothetical protein